MKKMKVLVLICLLSLLPSIAQAFQIAILPFQNDSEYLKAGDLASDMLSEELIKLKKVTIFDRIDLKSIIDEKKLQSSIIFDKDALAKIKFVGVDYIITGAVIDCRTETKYVRGLKCWLVPFPLIEMTDESVVKVDYAIVSVRAKLVDVNNGKVIWVKVETDKKEGKDPLPLLREAIKRLVKSLRKKL